MMKLLSFCNFLHFVYENWVICKQNTRCLYNICSKDRTKQCGQKSNGPINKIDVYISPPKYVIP